MNDLLAAGRDALASQPFSVMMGTEVVAYGDGAVELRLPITDQIKQGRGFVHGGVLAYLADNALTMAAALSLGGGVLTAEIKINYLRPAVGQTLIARAWTLSAGKTQGGSRCDVFALQDGLEKLCAAAQGTVLKAQAQPDAGTPTPQTADEEVA
jgi:uncharacterized protein (TIGR00369 family)